MDVRLRIVLMGRTANSLNLQNYPLQEDQAPRQVHVMIRPGHFEALYTESQVGLMGGLPTTPEGEERIVDCYSINNDYYSINNDCIVLTMTVIVLTMTVIVLTITTIV